MKEASIKKNRIGYGLPLANIIWMLIFAMYGGVAAIWWLITPHGFPFNHPRFWANFGFPLITSIVALLGILALFLSRVGFAKAVVVFFLGLTYSAFILSLIQFPISFGPSNGLRFLLFILVISGVSLLLLLLTVWFFWFHRKKTVPYALVIVGAVTSMMAGVGIVKTQQSLPPATVPLNGTIPTAFRNLSQSESRFQQFISFENGNEISPEDAVVQTQCGKLRLQISPILTFTSRSPDRFWTLFAPPTNRLGPRRYLSEHKLTDNRFLLGYIDDDRSWLDVQGGGQEPLKIESYTNLPNPIYSHLNSYASLIIVGGEQLEISFSAAGDVPTKFTEAGYPFGKPARMAYRNRSDRFLVVEASNAEKGPFRTIADGQLKRFDTLDFTLYNNGTPQCLISLEDWAAQASTQLSPTAGWGFTENAIGFQLLPSEPNELATGFIYISLANTSTGRGFDSVGHTAGLYRNRMQVESLNTELD